MRKVHHQQHLEAALDLGEMDQSNQSLTPSMEEVIEEKKFHNQLSSLFNIFIDIMEVNEGKVPKR